MQQTSTTIRIWWSVLTPLDVLLLSRADLNVSERDHQGGGMGGSHQGRQDDACLSYTLHVCNCLAYTIHCDWQTFTSTMIAYRWSRIANHMWYSWMVDHTLLAMLYSLYYGGVWEELMQRMRDLGGSFPSHCNLNPALPPKPATGCSTVALQLTQHIHCLAQLVSLLSWSANVAWEEDCLV